MQRRHLLQATLALTAPALAFADTWPSKPIRIIVPFAAGSFTETAARTLGAELDQERVLTVAQQAAAQAAENTTPEGKAGTPAGAQPITTAPAQGPLTQAASAATTGVQIDAASPEQVAQEAPQANAPQAGAASLKGTPAEEFIKTRTDVQLTWLSERGKGENKDLAKTELQRRQGGAFIPNGDGVGIVTQSGGAAVLMADAYLREHHIVKPEGFDG